MVDIKKAMWLTVALTLMLAVAHADGACTFPDPGELIGQTAQRTHSDYAFSDDYLCDVYQWTYPEGWDADRLGLVITGVAQAVGGWVPRADVIDGYDGYILTGPGGETAMLVPSFGGTVLLLVPPGCELVPVSHATPEPTPVPTPSPVPTATPQKTKTPTVRTDDSWNTGHWEWRTVEKDCPSCIGGVCSICHGTGTYRLYGEKVSCPTKCTSCNGKGTYTTQEYVHVP